MAMAAATPACSASELVAKGRESAAALQAMLGQQPVFGADATPQGIRDLAEQILRCCDRALAALLSHADQAASSCRKRKPERESDDPAVPPEATRSSSKRMRVNRGERGTRIEKKGTTEDGFIWRKYGQKDINGSNYPRLYFRCTYKDDQGCKARRQVQQSDADPSVFLITYFDEHTCCSNDDAEQPAPFVINFGCSGSDGQPTSGSPWPPSCEDDCVVATDTSALCNSPEEEEELRAGTDGVAEFIIEQSTPVPELMGVTSSPEWDPMDGCLDWELGYDESSFDIDEFFRYDFDYLLGLLQ